MTSSPNGKLIRWKIKYTCGTIEKTFYDINSEDICFEDGGIGRYILPLCTTQRRTTTNLKTKNNQNCQNIELYGSLTTKELKKKPSFRLLGGVERTHSKAVAGGPRWARWWLADRAVSHLHVDKLGGTTGERVRPHNPGFPCKKRKPQKL